MLNVDVENELFSCVGDRDRAHQHLASLSAPAVGQEGRQCPEEEGRRRGCGRGHVHGKNKGELNKEKLLILILYDFR